MRPRAQRSNLVEAAGTRSPEKVWCPVATLALTHSPQAIIDPDSCASEPPRPDHGSLRYSLPCTRTRFPHIAVSTLSRNSRFARAFAIVSVAVAPTLQHSTMIGPLNPAAFSVLKTPAKFTFPVPN